MLLNLKTIHKPTTLEEAITLLSQPGTYPLYGGVALHRRTDPAVEAAINLENLCLNYVRGSKNSLRLGSMLLLEEARQACLERAEKHPKLGAVAEILAAEKPETLRHTMTLGDLLMERDPQSPTLMLFLALGAVLKRIDVDMHFTTAAWLSASEDIRRYLIAHARITRGPQRAAVAYEKVSRTPADAPIVGAVACVEMNEGGPPRYTTLALCGVAPTPIPQPDVARTLDETGDIEAALDRLELDPPDDHWGSREYRTEMARVVARRALTRALEEIKAGDK